MRLSWDQFSLILLKFVRMTAYGQTAIILVGFLASIRWSDEQIGLFMSLTLFGDVLVSLLVGSVSHKQLVGPRTLLAISAIMLFASGIVFATCSNYWLLLTAAVLGVISPSGDEVGPFVSLESALIAHITPYTHRAVLFAIREMLGTFGLAVGLATGGWLADYGEHLFGVNGYRLIFWFYSVWAVLALVLICMLSRDCELSGQEEDELAEQITEQAGGPEDETSPLIERQVASNTAPGNATENAAAPAELPAVANDEERIAQKGQREGLSTMLCLIFGLDSLAYGFMTNSWVVEYMTRTFGASTTEIGQFLFISQMISALTSIPSVHLTNAIGPVLAIACTKFGAGAFGALVPAAHNMRQGMACILFRSLFDTMDVVPRNLFLTSVVPKDQMVAILSWVNIVKTMGRSIAPIGTGLLAARGLLWTCFFIMGALEVLFGVLVIGFFY